MSTEKTSKTSGRYLYAIVTGNKTRHFGPLGIGDQSVYTLSDGTISAVVSHAPNEKIRPQRRNLAAHQQVLKCLMAESTPLPMAFGIITDGDEAVKDILARYQKQFIVQLERVSGKMEMGLRVCWDVDNIFEYFIGIHPELRATRDTYFSSRGEPSKEDKIELGRMFDNLLQEDRENLTEQIEQTLSPCSFEIKQGKCRNEKEVMNLYCLVAREKEGSFEESILKAAGQFDNNFTFDYNGPFAPYNFVDVKLED